MMFSVFTCREAAFSHAPLTSQCRRLAGVQRNNRTRCITKPWSASADGVSDVARWQMPVMFLDHPGIGVAKVLSDHQKRHARHDRERCPAVTQDVERQPRRDLAVFARFLHWPRLLRRIPAAAVSVPEHDFAAGAAGTVMLEEIGTFRRQDHMAWLATLGFADGNSTGIRIEVLHLKPGQFAVSAARLQRRAHKRTEVGVAR